MVANEMTVAPKKRLRIGILLNSYQTAAWAAKVIADLRRSDWAEIVLVVTRRGKPEPKKSHWERLVRFWKIALYSLPAVFIKQSSVRPLAKKAEARLSTSAGARSETLSLDRNRCLCRLSGRSACRNRRRRFRANQKRFQNKPFRAIEHL
jgi:hypothetical protein